jgi:hypothetical protein
METAWQSINKTKFKRKFSKYHHTKTVVYAVLYRIAALLDYFENFNICSEKQFSTNIVISFYTAVKYDNFDRKKLKIFFY